MYNLDKFIDQQDIIYSSILDELRSGRKSRHWMWYIFPQIKGLGKTAKCKKQKNISTTQFLGVG